MDFLQKIKEIISIMNMESLKKLLKIFKVENEDELKILYDNNREYFMEIMFEYEMSQETYFNPLLIEDRDFLNSYNPQIRSYINNRILQGNDNEINYFETNQFKYKDFTIDDFLTIVNILDKPQLPITRYYFDDQHHSNKDQMILKIFNESSYKSINALKEMSKNYINRILDDYFKFILNNGKVYNLNKSLTDQFEIFRIVRSNEIKLNTDNNLIVEILIEFLCVGSFDYKSLSEDNLLELLEIADYLQISTLIQIINLIFDNTNIEDERNIKTTIIDIEKWLASIIFRFMSEEESDDFLINNKNNLLKNVENQNIEGIKESLNLIKIKIKEYIDKDNNQMLILYFETNFINKNLFIEMLNNIYKLPNFLKAEYNKI